MDLGRFRHGQWRRRAGFSSSDRGGCPRGSERLGRGWHFGGMFVWRGGLGISRGAGRACANPWRRGRGAWGNFVPSLNPGVTSEGEVPGDHGLRYALNNDEGTLRLTNEDGEIVAAASLGQGGICYDTKTGTPFARAIGGSVVIDAQALENRAVPKETADAAAEDARGACGGEG